MRMRFKNYSMEHEMKKKINLKLNKIALATSSALTVLVMPTVLNAAATPYAQTPLIWQSGTSTIRPNILLFLDTSGSMGSKNGTSTRLQVAKNSIKGVIGDTRGDYKWGLATFVARNPNGNLQTRDVQALPNAWKASSQNDWYSAGGQILRNVDYIDSTTPQNHNNFTTLNNTIDALQANTNTPIPSSFYELIRYYRGMTPGFRNLPTPDGGANYTSPVEYRCQKNYIIYISDGEPTGLALRYQLAELYHNDALMSSLRGSIWANRGNNTSVANEISAFAFNNDLIVGGTDNEGKSFDDAGPDPVNNNMAMQNITTYTIGFTANVALLNNMATQGGGSYLLANDEAGLKSALLQSLNSIGRSAGYTPSTLSVATDVSNNVRAAASTTVDPTTWTSELRFYPYNTATKSFDLNSYKVPRYLNGNSLTSRALISSNLGVDLISQNTVPASYNNALFGISNTRIDTPTSDNLVIPITKSSNNNEYKALLGWLLRWNANDTASGVNYRDRNRGVTSSLARYMGDVAGNVIELGRVKVTASSPSDFNRKEYLAVPSNDGMLHILKANEGANQVNIPYEEVLQYIPGTAQRQNSNDTIMRNLVFTAEKKYGDLRNPKQNFLAGELLHYTTAEGEITLINGLGSGARGLYALTVGGKDQSNNPVGLNQAVANWSTSVPMWDTSTSKFGAANSIYDQTGYNFGLPKAGYLSVSGSNWNSDVRTAAFITSGMDDPQKATPSLFVLDHMAKNYANGFSSTGTKGQLIKQIPITRSYDQTASAETSVAEIVQAHDGLTSAQGIDYNRDGLVDLMYAGDYKGNIWRFDLRDASPANWGAKMVFKGNGSQPLVAEPDLMAWKDGTVGIYFGTGSNLYQSDLNAKDQQSLYGIFDHVDDCAVNNSTGICAPAEKSDLIEQTLQSEVIGGVTSYFISSNNTYPSVADKRGFFIDLPSQDYRITTTPTILTVGKRTKAGAIFNIEKVDGSSSSSGAVQTCTPDQTSSSGFRLIVDAESGITSEYIKWPGEVKSSTGQLISSIPYAGSSSKSALLTANIFAVTGRGTLTSGIATKLVPEDDCVGTGYLASSTSTDGGKIDEVTCKNPDISGVVKRLSWREIF